MRCMLPDGDEFAKNTEPAEAQCSGCRENEKKRGENR